MVGVCDVSTPAPNEEPWMGGRPSRGGRTAGGGGRAGAEGNEGRSGGGRFAKAKSRPGEGVSVSVSFWESNSYLRQGYPRQS